MGGANCGAGFQPAWLLPPGRQDGCTTPGIPARRSKSRIMPLNLVPFGSHLNHSTKRKHEQFSDEATTNERF
jgi:hypothetical protein